ncbi:putative methyltransferase [Tieghemostelium lacteum]|uniref:Putative methyltransferase n=1 Tax=Tieghemostelium lacteum TaxID=361077 RepID=A0A152A2N6_TIELA|nr:putative methyltransferase [Tieghemostelium lacteum]|eukprot:KYR00464.1 putative methyltransferase [Tieghemostelium lacteum]
MSSPPNVSEEVLESSLNLFEIESSEEEIIYSNYTYKRVEPIKNNPDIKEITVRLTQRHSLWAHLVWNAGIAFSDFIDQSVDCKNKNVLELGAAAGLPSFIAALNGAKKVLLTDYPDKQLIDNLEYNVDNTIPDEISKDRTYALPYLWGKDTQPLLEYLPKGEKFDIVILSDLIFNHTCHRHLLDSCTSTLADNGIIYVIFSHHRPHRAAKDLEFFTIAEEEYNFKSEKFNEKKMKAMFEEDLGPEEVRSTVHYYTLKWKTHSNNFNNIDSCLTYLPTLNDEDHVVFNPINNHFNSNILIEEIDFSNNIVSNNTIDLENDLFSLKNAPIPPIDNTTLDQQIVPPTLLTINTELNQPLIYSNNNTNLIYTQQPNVSINYIPTNTEYFTNEIINNNNSLILYEPNNINNFIIQNVNNNNNVNSNSLEFEIENPEYEYYSDSEVEEDNDMSTTESEDDVDELEDEEVVNNENNVKFNTYADLLIRKLHDFPIDMQGKFKQFIQEVFQQDQYSTSLFPMTLIPQSKFYQYKIDFNFQSYIISQKMDKIDSIQFKKPVEYLNNSYSLEIAHLDSEFKNRKSFLHRIHSKISVLRPLLNLEISMKIKQTKSLFQIIKSYQKANTCNVVLQVLKKYAREFKSRRILSDEQEKSLNTWYENNMNDPYPDEDQKVVLGALNNLSKSQIDNWFGNKRMRQKKREREDGSNASSSDGEDGDYNHYSSDGENENIDPSTLYFNSNNVTFENI